MKKTKQCSKCGETKPLAAFYRWRICKACLNEYRRTPEFRARKRSLYRDPSSGRWATCAIAGAKNRAKKRGIPFDLNQGDLGAIPAVCPVLGIQLTIGKPMSPNCPTLDCIDPRLGYVRGNVAIISWLANKIKGDVTDPKIFERIAKYMRRMLKAA